MIRKKSCSILFLSFLLLSAFIISNSFKKEVCSDNLNSVKSWENTNLEIPVIKTDNTLNEQLEINITKISDIYDFSPSDIVANENYAYISSYGGGFVVMDISSASFPAYHSELDLDNICPSNIALQDNTIIIMGEEGIAVCDVTDPLVPTLVGEWVDTNLSITDMAFDGDYIYLTDREKGFVIIDASDKTNPFKLFETSDSSDSFFDITLYNNYAYLTKYNGILQIMDITNPSSPINITNINLEMDINDVLVNDSKLFVLSDELISIYDITVINNPIFVTNVSLEPLSWGHPYEFCIQRNYVFVASGLDSWFIVDLEDIGNPIFWISAPYGTSYDIFATENVVLVIGFYWTFKIWDITDIHSPEISYEKDSDNTIFNIACCSNNIFVPQGNRVDIIDVSNPTYPTIISTLNEQIDEIKIFDNHAFLIDSGGIMLLYDISEPSLPLKKSEITFPNSICQIYVENDTLFVTLHNDNLLLYDISEITEPSIISSFNVSTDYEDGDIVVKGSYAFVSARDKISIIDVSVRTSPQFVGELSIDACTLDIYGNYLYVMNAYETFCILDVSNPENPKIIKTFDEIDSDLSDITVTHQFIFLMTEDLGLLIYNNSNPENPTQLSYNLLGTVYPVIYGYEVHIEEDFLYIPTGWVGLEIYYMSLLEKDTTQNGDDNTETSTDTSITSSKTYESSFEFFSTIVIATLLLVCYINIVKKRNNNFGQE